MSTDPLDEVFNLEDRFYTEGYTTGLQDGEQAGRIEGRSFGMQKGFEKFLESGRLASKSIVWANRIPERTGTTTTTATTGGGGDGSAAGKSSKPRECTLPPLSGNARLDKNVKMLYALVEPDTLSTANTDEAVQDFDDRVKRAQGKAKVVERTVG